MRLQELSKANHRYDVNKLLTCVLDKTFISLVVTP